MPGSSPVNKNREAGLRLEDGIEIVEESIDRMTGIPDGARNR